MFKGSEIFFDYDGSNTLCEKYKWINSPEKQKLSIRSLDSNSILTTKSNGEKEKTFFQKRKREEKEEISHLCLQNMQEIFTAQKKMKIEKTINININLPKGTEVRLSPQNRISRLDTLIPFPLESIKIEQENKIKKIRKNILKRKSNKNSQSEINKQPKNIINENSCPINCILPTPPPTTTQINHIENLTCIQPIYQINNFHISPIEKKNENPINNNINKDFYQSLKESRVNQQKEIQNKITKYFEKKKPEPINNLIPVILIEESD